jgi:hypothetical protein
MASHVRALSGYRFNYAKNALSRWYQRAKYLTWGGGAGYLVQEWLLPSVPQEIAKKTATGLFSIITNEFSVRALTGLAVATLAMAVIRLGRFILFNRRIREAAREFIAAVGELRQAQDEAAKATLYCRIVELRNQLDGVVGPGCALPFQEPLAARTRFELAVREEDEGAFTCFEGMRGLLPGITASGTVPLPKTAVPTQKPHISEGEVLPLLNHPDAVMVERGLLVVREAREVGHKEILEQTAGALEKLAATRRIRPQALLSSAIPDPAAVIDALEGLKTNPELAPRVVEAEVAIHLVRGEDFIWEEAQAAVKRLLREKGLPQTVKEQVTMMITLLSEDKMSPRRDRQAFYREFFNQDRRDLFSLVLEVETRGGRREGALYKEVEYIQTLFALIQRRERGADPICAAAVLRELAQYLPEGRALIYTDINGIGSVIARVRVLLKSGIPEQRKLAEEVLPTLLKQQEEAVKGGGGGPITAAPAGGGAAAGAKRASGK